MDLIFFQRWWQEHLTFSMLPIRIPVWYIMSFLTPKYISDELENYVLKIRFFKAYIKLKGNHYQIWEGKGILTLKEMKEITRE